MLKKSLLAFLPFFFCWQLEATTPHEVLLVINQEDPDSIAIANHYAALRNIPIENRVYVSLDTTKPQNQIYITERTFRKNIWEPIKERLDKQDPRLPLSGCILSTGFPLGIQQRPPVSLHGALFNRGTLPPPEEVKNGTAGSPMFAGPNLQGTQLLPSKSLDRFAHELKNKMPLPTMSLGYTGKRGNEPHEIIAYLNLAAQADFTGPDSARFVWVETDDVRTKCRSWQFDVAQKIMENKGHEIIISGYKAHKHKNLMGMLHGAAWLPFLPYQNNFLPGSIVEHLTSFGAFFSNPHQKKVSNWLRSGAAATCGTITEPYSNPAKFPVARVFDHYTAGCSALDSFYLSVYSPFQQYFLGDPLVRPFAPKGNLRLDLKQHPNFFSLQVNTKNLPQASYYFYTFINQAFHPKYDPDYRLPKQRLRLGYNVITSYALANERVSHYYSVSTNLYNPPPKGTPMLGLQTTKTTLGTPTVTITGKVSRTQTFSGTVHVNGNQYDLSFKVPHTLDPTIFEHGKNQIYLSWKNNKDTIYSQSHWIDHPTFSLGNVDFNDFEITSLIKQRFPLSTYVLQTKTIQPAPYQKPKRPPKRQPWPLVFQPLESPSENAQGWVYELGWEKGFGHFTKEVLGVVFNYKNTNTFSFIGMANSSWVYAEVKNKTWNIKHEVPAPVHFKGTYQLMLHHEDHTLHVYVNGKLLFNHRYKGDLIPYGIVSQIPQNHTTNPIHIFHEASPTDLTESTDQHQEWLLVLPEQARYLKK